MADPAGIDRSAARLLRLLGNAGCLMVEEGGALRIVRPDGGESPVAADVVAVCIRRGLALRRGDRLFATREARAWLRRYLADREEAFLDQHRVTETVERASGAAREILRINATASPLSALARLKDRAGAAWLPPEAVDAGERLARDFHYGALQPRVTQSYEARAGESRRPGPGGAADLADSVIAARLRVAAAVEAMGPELSGVAPTSAASKRAWKPWSANANGRRARPS